MKKKNYCQKPFGVAGLHAQTVKIDLAKHNSHL